MPVKHRTPNRKIRQLLKQAGITVTQFAFDLGITIARASTIANGYVIPADSGTRASIASYFETTEADLWPNLKGVE